MRRIDNPFIFFFKKKSHFGIPAERVLLELKTGEPQAVRFHIKFSIKDGLFIVSATIRDHFNLSIIWDLSKHLNFLSHGVVLQKLQEKNISEASGDQTHSFSST